MLKPFSFILLCFFILTPVYGSSVNLQSGQKIIVSCNGTTRDADCISAVSSECFSNSNYSSTQCFSKVSEYCPSQEFAQCFSQTREYCFRNTNLNSNQCVDRALAICKGETSSILELFDAIKATKNQ